MVRVGGWGGASLASLLREGNVSQASVCSRVVTSKASWDRSHDNGTPSCLPTPLPASSLPDITPGDLLPLRQT